MINIPKVSRNSREQCYRYCGILYEDSFRRNCLSSAGVSASASVRCQLGRVKIVIEDSMRRCAGRDLTNEESPAVQT